MAAPQTDKSQGTGFYAVDKDEEFITPKTPKPLFEFLFKEGFKVIVRQFLLINIKKLMLNCDISRHPPKCSTSSVLNALSCLCCLRPPQKKKIHDSSMFTTNTAKPDETKLLEFLNREQYLPV